MNIDKDSNLIHKVFKCTFHSNVKFKDNKEIKVKSNNEIKLNKLQHSMFSNVFLNYVFFEFIWKEQR